MSVTEGVMDRGSSMSFLSVTYLPSEGFFFTMKYFRDRQELPWSTGVRDYDSYRTRVPLLFIGGSSLFPP